MSSMAEQFAKPVGTIFTVLPEIGVDGNPNLMFFSNESRSFIFDAVFRVVTFKTKTTTGKIVTLDLPFLEGKNGMHLLKLKWDNSKSFTLGVDGVDKDYTEGENK